MGWLGKVFGKAKREDSEAKQDQIRPEISGKEQLVRLSSNAERKTFIKDNGEIIAESFRQIEEAKVEYEAVTSYLTDMQKIDGIQGQERGIIEDAARNIINLNKERDSLRNRKYDITDVQYRVFERYEMQLPKELSSLREAESYQKDIDGDIARLEKEKQSLLDEEEDIISKQAFLKGIAKTTFVVVVVLFAIFAFLSGTTGSNMTLPFLLTVLMGMISSIYIFMEARKNTHDIKVVQLKLSKVVMLSNKVAIKAVNNRNYLDYCYNKYMVDDYNQLKKCWEQYVKLKEENIRFKSNSQLLEYYNNILVKELKRHRVADSEIWIYQPSAILDNKEMVEVRHRLNVRRQKIRERIQANKNQQDEAIKTLVDLMNAYPDCEAEVMNVLNKYKLEDDISRLMN